MNLPQNFMLNETVGQKGVILADFLLALTKYWALYKKFQ